MTTIDERSYTSTFAGLQSTAITSGSVLVGGLLIQEYLKRLRRYPDEDKRRKNGDTTVPDRGMEGFAMGYLYRARSFVPVMPSPDFSARPLGWVWSTSFKLPEKFYETHVGADATAYLRFLRGCFYWTLVMTCTVFPVLLGINYHFADSSVSLQSLDRASLASLAKSPTGFGLLWVHVVAIWFMTVTWYAVLTWFGYGVIRVRRNTLRSLLRTQGKLVLDETQEKKAGAKALPPAYPPERRPEDLRDERPVGWRFRTVLIRNIPPSMRSEKAIAQYFEQGLRGTLSSNEPSPPTSTTVSPALSSRPFDDKPVMITMGQVKSNETVSEKCHEKSGKVPPLISEIVLVRKQAELNELYNKYRAVQNELENAHCQLAENVMAFVRSKVVIEQRLQRGERARTRVETIRHALRTPFRSRKAKLTEEMEQKTREGDTTLVQRLRRYLPGEEVPDTSLWEALHALHDENPRLFDRFQPLIKLTHFRGQKVPSIDYHLAKMNLLATLIEDQRANPERFEPASSAFVTFERASDARRARLEMSSRNQRKTFATRSLECKVKKAPEFRDLDYNRLVLVSLSSDILRGAILQTFIWAATIFWVIPLSFLVGLFSLESISKYIPRLADFLENHTATQTLFNSLLPTSIVALISMLVPTLIGIITRNGQALITVTKLHAVVQSRYWKWQVVNLILVFCIGITAFNAFLNAFKTPGSVLQVVAEAFPKGATFFVSWTLLVVGVHHGIEICMLGIPWINHATIRKLRTPRKREFEAQPRSFNYAYWAPNHLLVLGITAIFSILNPLVIAFNFFYQLMVLTVFKNQFAHVYWRRWYENNGRFVFRRTYRYSLDMFTMGHVIIVAFLFVAKRFRLGGACIPLIPITVFIKVVGTRWFDKLMDELDEAEIDVVCGEEENMSKELSVPLTEADEDMHRLAPREMASTVKDFTLTTLPALTLHPKARLPIVPSPRKSAKSIKFDGSGQISTVGRPHIQSRTNSGRPRAQSAGSQDDDRPMLQAATSFGGRLESDSKNSYEQDLIKQRERKLSKSGKLDLYQFSRGEVSDDSDAQPDRIVTVHAPIIRDDRPVTNVRYHNPAQVARLERSLWLPRDPLKPVDLGDTIDYHGHALVSSEGGNGAIGFWEEDESKGPVMPVIKSVEGETSVTDALFEQAPPLTLVSTRETSATSSSAAALGSMINSAKIRVASDVARTIEAEDGIRINPRNKAVPMPSLDDAASQLSASLSDARAPGLQPSSSAKAIHLSLASESQLQSSPLHSPALPTRDIPATPHFEGDHATAATSAVDEPSTPTHQRRASLRSRKSFTEDENAAHTVITVGPVVPTSSHVSGRSRSPASSRSRGPRGRTGSIAVSMQASIAEGVEPHEVVTISQTQALMSELIEEERIEHERRMQKESVRKQKEEQDKRPGWFSRMLLANAPDVDTVK
ncbi:hypothetical protein OIV83_001880 [Microbotryomycetes sp. JL201]|nr:hypothetical protein OIV83_001880 [Microbotryomycetes sp. JL201]